MARELRLAALAVLIGACGRDEPASLAPRTAAAPLASKAFYRIDAGPAAPCAPGTRCAAAFVLTALGDYHVNKDYPFKFVGDPPPALPIDGTGTFVLDDARHGTLTIRFRPEAAGAAQLAGTFKLSVCSDETCEIETPRLALAVPVR